MILVDSNILIDYYRDRKSELAKKIDSMQIGICGVVKSEVLHGAKNYDEVDNVEKAQEEVLETMFLDAKNSVIAIDCRVVR